ncbi:MAG: hypothetical protein ACPG30_00930 [Parvibaculales bacterium]
MAQYDKNSPEYVNNGHYKINDKEYLSIWAFKKKYDIEPNNNGENGKEGKELAVQALGDIHSCIPDFGEFNNVFIYPIDELAKYYGV